MFSHGLLGAMPGSTPQGGVEPEMGDVEFQIQGVENANENAVPDLGC